MFWIDYHNFFHSTIYVSFPVNLKAALLTIGHELLKSFSFLKIRFSWKRFFCFSQINSFFLKKRLFSSIRIVFPQITNIWRTYLHSSRLCRIVNRRITFHFFVCQSPVSIQSFSLIWTRHLLGWSSSTSKSKVKR